jgi:hypothetical protein
VLASVLLPVTCPRVLLFPLGSLVGRASCRAVSAAADFALAARGGGQDLNLVPLPAIPACQLVKL